MASDSVLTCSVSRELPVTPFLRQELSRQRFSEDGCRQQYLQLRRQLQATWDKLVAVREVILRYRRELEVVRQEVAVAETRRLLWEREFTKVADGNDVLMEHSLKFASREAELRMLREKVREREVLSQRIKELGQEAGELRQKVLVLSQYLKESTRQAFIEGEEYMEVFSVASVSRTMEVRGDLLRSSQRLDQLEQEAREHEQRFKTLQLEIDLSIRHCEQETVSARGNRPGATRTAELLSSFDVSPLKRMEDPATAVERFDLGAEVSEVVEIVTKGLPFSSDLADALLQRKVSPLLCQPSELVETDSVAELSLDEVLSGQAEVLRMNGEPALSYVERVERRLVSLHLLERQMVCEFMDRWHELLRGRGLLRDLELRRLRLEKQIGAKAEESEASSLQVATVEKKVDGQAVQSPSRKPLQVERTEEIWHVTGTSEDLLQKIRKLLTAGPKDAAQSAALIQEELQILALIQSYLTRRTAHARARSTDAGSIRPPSMDGSEEKGAAEPKDRKPPREGSKETKQQKDQKKAADEPPPSRVRRGLRSVRPSASRDASGAVDLKTLDRDKFDITRTSCLACSVSPPLRRPRLHELLRNSPSVPRQRRAEAVDLVTGGEDVSQDEEDRGVVTVEEQLRDSPPLVLPSSRAANESDNEIASNSEEQLQQLLATVSRQEAELRDLMLFKQRMEALVASRGEMEVKEALIQQTIPEVETPPLPRQLEEQAWLVELRQLRDDLAACQHESEAKEDQSSLVTLEVDVELARHLPTMKRTSKSCDAYVEAVVLASERWSAAQLMACLCDVRLDLRSGETQLQWLAGMVEGMDGMALGYQRTRIQRGTCYPEWQETINISLVSPPSRWQNLALWLLVKDAVKGGRRPDEIIGHAMLDLPQIRHLALTLELRPPNQSRRRPKAGQQKPQLKVKLHRHGPWRSLCSGAGQMELQQLLMELEQALKRVGAVGEAEVKEWCRRAQRWLDVPVKPSSLSSSLPVSTTVSTPSASIRPSRLITRALGLREKEWLQRQEAQVLRNYNTTPQPRQKRPRQQAGWT